MFESSDVKNRPASFSIATCLAFVLSCTAGAETLRVGDSSGYSTISEALTAAADFDTILVASGTYNENLAIDRPLILIGEDTPHIRGLEKGDVVQVLGDDVEMRGFRVSGSGNNMMVSDAGIKIFGTRARILNNEVFDVLFGVYLRGCTEALVEGNVIRGRVEVEMGRRGAGVHFFDAHHNTVRGNDISLVRDGVYFDHADFNTVEDNEFSHLRYGVHYMYCKDNRFFRNIFRDSVGGVAVMYTERVVFRDNQILNNREGFNAFGLLFKDALDSVAEGNVIINSVNGVFLDSSHRIEIRNNLIAYNDVGVMLYASSLENSFGGNDFVGNLATLHTVGRADADWTPEGLGNYYFDYTGYDIDGDGIGDTPHRLQDAFEYLEGSRPLLRLFLNSAAADALAVAERSFPIVPSSEEVDAAPRMKPVSDVRLTYRYGARMQPDRSTFLAGGSLAVLLLCGLVSWRLRG
jgi:nitrous oxidase accessory protein